MQISNSIRLGQVDTERRTYVWVPHILGPTNQPRNGDLDLLQQIPPLILEDGNVEEDNPLDALIAIGGRHGLEASAAVSHGGNGAGVDGSVLGRSAARGPVQRRLHVRDHGLGGSGSAPGNSVRRDDIAVACDLEEQILVGCWVGCAAAVAPCDDGHGDAGWRWRLGGIDGVFCQLGVCEGLGGIGSGSGGGGGAASWGLGAGSSGVVAGTGEIGS